MADEQSMSQDAQPDSEGTPQEVTNGDANTNVEIVEAQSETTDSKTEKGATPAEEAKSSPSTLWKFIAPKLMTAFNLTAFLTVAGFFVIHSYIASFSDFYTYSIPVSHYLIAGINMALCIFIFLILLVIVLIPIIIPSSIFGGILGAVIGAGILISPLRKWKNQIAKFLDAIQKVFMHSLLIMILIIVGILGYFYGTYVYDIISRSFGGGMPADVILIFNEAQDVQNPIWPFAIDPTNPKKSMPVQLLVELTDGIIVRQSPDKSAVIIKNSVLQGIIDVLDPVSTP